MEKIAAVIAYGDGLSPILDRHRRTASAALDVALEEAIAVVNEVGPVTLQIFADGSKMMDSRNTVEISEALRSLKSVK